MTSDEVRKEFIGGEMPSILLALLLVSDQTSFVPDAKTETQSEIVMEADASVSPIIADANQRYSRAGYSFSNHSIQVRRQGSNIYIDYLYKAGPKRGGVSGDPCRVSVTYEYEAGKFVRLYFAR